MGRIGRESPAIGSYSDPLHPSFYQVTLPRLLFLLSLILTFVALPTARALEADLNFVRGCEGNLNGPRAHLVLSFKATRPPGDYVLPALNHPTPAYAQITLGDRAHLLVLDRTDNEKMFYDKLLVDRNGNGDLTDDAPQRASAYGADVNQCMSAFSSVRVLVHDGDQEAPYELSFQVFAWQPSAGKPLDSAAIESRMQAFCISECGYRADVDVYGRDLTMWVVDMDVDGRFGEACADPVDLASVEPFSSVSLMGDRLGIWERENGRLQTVPMAKLVLVGGVLHEMQVDLSAKRLTLTPFTGVICPAELAMDVDVLMLHGLDGAPDIAMHRPGLEVMIPPGRYEVLEYCAHRNDQKGDLWLATAVPGKERASTDLGENGGPLSFGEPFKPMAYVAGQNPTPQQGYLEFALMGVAGEVVSSVQRVAGSRTKNGVQGNRPNPPTFKIVNPEGEVAFRGDFRYG